MGITIMTKWFWAVCIAATLLNAGIFRFRARRHIRGNPALADGYATLIRGFVLWGNIPWVVMGVGCLLGGVPSIDHFLRPREGNPFVLAFFASVFLVWVLGTYWLLFRGGAEMLVEHPGLLNMDFRSPLMVKLFWLLCLAGGIVAVTVMFATEVPWPSQKE
jgi:hypothetical protein